MTREKPRRGKSERKEGSNASREEGKEEGRGDEGKEETREGGRVLSPRKWLKENSFIRRC